MSHFLLDFGKEGDDVSCLIKNPLYFIYRYDINVQEIVVLFVYRFTTKSLD